MLNNLYRKLHILFASSVMLIITLVISFVVANTVHTEKINESILFQRLTTLLIYQVESASSDMDKSLKTYEKSYHIFSLISDTKGNTIYQSDFPFPTSADNLLFSKWKCAEIDNSLLMALGVTDLQKKLYTELSAGQKRRLHLALALIGKPDILFLDEPTTELDVEGRISLHNEIRKLNQNGTTIILSSHDMAEVEALCTRIAILNNGVISFIGTTDELASKVGKKYNIKIVSELGENEYSAVNVADTLLSILEEYKQKNIDIFDIKVNRGTLEQHFINLSRGGVNNESYVVWNKGTIKNRYSQ